MFYISKLKMQTPLLQWTQPEKHDFPSLHLKVVRSHKPSVNVKDYLPKLECPQYFLDSTYFDWILKLFMQRERSKTTWTKKGGGGVSQMSTLLNKSY